MSGNTLTFPQKGIRDENKQIKERTYSQLVISKLLHDKITLFAIFLLLFMVTITVAAPWFPDVGATPSTKTRPTTRSPTGPWSTEASRMPSWPGA